MTPQELKRLDGYGRQSRDESGQSESLASQRERTQAHCVVTGATFGMWHQDPNVSGSIPPEDRPGFAAALKRLEDGKTDGIIVTDLSRLSRAPVAVTLELVRKVHEDLNGALVILDIGGQTVDPSTPTGEAILTVLLAMARLEWRTIADKTFRGKMAGVIKGKKTATAPPGYLRRDDGLLAPDPALADGVRRVFEISAADGFAAARDAFEELTGRRLSTQSLRRMLANRTYRGEMRFGENKVRRVQNGAGKWVKRVEPNPLPALYIEPGQSVAEADQERPLIIRGAHEALVTEALFARAQHGPNGSRRPAGRFSLSLFAECAGCGSTLTGSTTRHGKRSYRCGSQGGRKDAPKCDAAAWANADELEAHVEELLYAELADEAADTADESVWNEPPAQAAPATEALVAALKAATDDLAGVEALKPGPIKDAALTAATIERDRAQEALDAATSEPTAAERQAELERLVAEAEDLRALGAMLGVVPVVRRGTEPVAERVSLRRL
jgi:site-specific DNA recombinase